MSYKKAMKHFKNIQKCKKQGKMYMGFSLLNPNERRLNPIFGASVMELPDDERKKRVEEYHEETKRLLSINPKLKLV